jgi:Chemoreceptor zinc-binding domain
MGFFSRLFNWDDNAPVEVKPTRPPASEMGLDAETARAVLAEIDIDTAIAAHENWKLRLASHLAGTSDEPFDPAVVCLDDRCELGKWLHGAGQKSLGKYPAFDVLVSRHRYFHVQASTVLVQKQSGDVAAAERTLNGPFKHGSNQVVLLLKELKRGLGGR